jgi:hypothetical protein
VCHAFRFLSKPGDAPAAEKLEKVVRPVNELLVGLFVRLA